MNYLYNQSTDIYSIHPQIVNDELMFTVISEHNNPIFSTDKYDEAHQKLVEENEEKGYKLIKIYISNNIVHFKFSK
jgi:maltose-binding protein MalE